MNGILHNTVVWVGLGGAAGSSARYLLAQGVQRLSGSLFPFGTMAVNVLGCLAVGFLSIRLEGSTVPAHLRMALLVGVLGGFTTFSTFSLETMSLLERREVLLAVGNVLVTLVACLAGCWAGLRIARGMLP